MQLTLALLADYANVARDGKLNIMGIFEQILALQFPAVHASMQLVTRVEASPFEAGKHDARVVFIDADARELFSVPGTLSIPESRAGENTTTNHIFIFNGVMLPKPGLYEFVISADTEELGRVPLRVLTMTAEPGSNP